MYLGEMLGDRSVASLQNKTWLWDALRQSGYATLKAEDNCVLNSNMVASMRPRTTHGEQLAQLFCYDFAEPNCLGDRSAAFGREPIQSYLCGTRTECWVQSRARFLCADRQPRCS